MQTYVRRGVITLAAAASGLGFASTAAATGQLPSVPEQSRAQVSAPDDEPQAAAQGSPGLLSGNKVELDVSAPVNVCGNSVNGVAAGNPATGNACANGPEATEVPPPVEPTPPTERVVPAPEAPRPAPAPAAGPEAAPEANVPATQLAATGAAESAAWGLAGTGILLGGVIMYRRGRVQN